MRWGTYCVFLEDGEQFVAGAVADSMDSYSQSGLISAVHSPGDLCHWCQGHAALAHVFVGLQRPIGSAHDAAIVAAGQAQAIEKGVAARWASS
jgi:hypothetical protein